MAQDSVQHETEMLADGLMYSLRVVWLWNLVFG
jgi:hypothetical protein